MNRPARGTRGIHGQLLTHMRNVAYAPVVLPASKPSADVFDAAELKRLRKAEKRKRECTV